MIQNTTIQTGLDRNREQCIELAEAIAESFENLALGIRQNLKYECANGDTKDMVRELALVTNSIGNCLSSLATSPLGQTLQDRMEIEEMLHESPPEHVTTKKTLSEEIHDEVEAFEGTVHDAFVDIAKKRKMTKSNVQQHFYRAKRKLQTK